MSDTANPADPHAGKGQIKVRATLHRFAEGADVDEYRRKYGKEEGERRFHEENQPVEEHEVEGNLLTTLGAGAFYLGLTGGSLTAFNNANAALGVGDSSTAEAVGQTNLQAVTNAVRQGMDATYPILATNQATFKATFGTSVGNFAWNEWAIFNAVGTGSPPTGGTMLDRKVSALGTKTSAASWALTVVHSLT